jgi:hypothetical protein
MWYDAQVSEIDRLPRVAVNKDLRSSAEAKLVSVHTDIAKLLRGKQPAEPPKSDHNNHPSSYKIPANEKAEMQRELKRLLALQAAAADAPRVLSNYERPTWSSGSGSLLSSTVSVNSHAEFLLVLADSIPSLDPNSLPFYAVNMYQQRRVIDFDVYSRGSAMLRNGADASARFSEIKFALSLKLSLCIDRKLL